MTIGRAAIAAATITLAAVCAIPATAHAADGREKFASPSGNIRCILSTKSAPTLALCQLEHIDYVVPAGLAHDADGGPCPSDSGSGRDVRLDQGQPGYVTCSYAALDGGVGPWPTLAYGESQSLGGITCASELAALTCTDTTTGHVFRVSQGAFEVG